MCFLGDCLSWDVGFEHYSNHLYLLLRAQLCHGVWSRSSIQSVRLDRGGRDLRKSGRIVRKAWSKDRSQSRTFVEWLERQQQKQNFALRLAGRVLKTWLCFLFKRVQPMVKPSRFQRTIRPTRLQAKCWARHLFIQCTQKNDSSPS